MNIQNLYLNTWVKRVADLCQPDEIFWLDGSEEEKQKLEDRAVASGDLVKLDQEKLPGCFYHRSAPDDVARTEGLTYICTSSKADAGPTNNWMSPDDGYQKAGDILNGSMKGRTMYVIPFCMGRLTSPFAKIGVQLTDSVYVALNMRMMTHTGAPVLQRLGASSNFTRCVHSKADLRPDRRLILHFPEDNTIWSVGSGYGGNALLGKKCLSLRLGSYLGRQEGWLAEHMLIMGVQDPSGAITYIAAAFPSACGKTNLAMLVPPEKYQKLGYRIWTVGDDIAWLRIDQDGFLRAMNPETGVFGVAPGTNSRTNPNAVAAVRRNAIFTNVLLKPDRTVWWEQADGPTPVEGINWEGRPWKPGLKDAAGKPVAGAHANSRFTAPIDQVPSFAKDAFNDPAGVKISAIVFGGRRDRLAPLVCEARSWRHGVYLGATMASERTAAQVGKLGELRRDPMAMLPFCGYNMGDYFQHWLDMGRRLNSPPRIFHVNWFRRGPDGQLLWPGYGDNLRILTWMIARCRHEVDAHDGIAGRIPYRHDIDLDGLAIGEEQWDSLFASTPAEWRAELEREDRFFEMFGDRFPPELREEQDALRNRVKHFATPVL
jgi:phosphoenolpyruvate carboxykinase (GTP)